MNATDQLFTGRDILAAENHLRCVPTLADAEALVAQMPATVVERLASYVGASSGDLSEVARRARLARSAR